MLTLSVRLALGDPSAERDVTQQYLERIVRPAIRHRRQRPILLWHVPKCSGTSVLSGLAQFYYGRRLRLVVPGYTCMDLLRYCVERVPEEFPLLTTSHMGVEQLSPSDEIFQFTVLRDPVKRALSAWRQNRLAEVRGFSLVPRHGDDWFYWPPPSFSEWLDRVPQKSLCRQLTTFAPDGDVDEATRRIAALDYLVVYDRGVGSLDGALEAMGVPLEAAELPRDLNRSPRTAVPTDAEVARARRVLRSEFELLDRVCVSEPAKRAG
jgi:hypothetical protein